MERLQLAVEEFGNNSRVCEIHAKICSRQSNKTFTSKSLKTFWKLSLIMEMCSKRLLQVDRGFILMIQEVQKR